jgi:hypothetical protein
MTVTTWKQGTEEPGLISTYIDIEEEGGHVKIEPTVLDVLMKASGREAIGDVTYTAGKPNPAANPGALLGTAKIHAFPGLFHVPVAEVHDMLTAAGWKQVK